MKAFRHICGILLATFGALFTISVVAQLFDRDPDLQLWLLALAWFVFGLIPLAGAFLLLRPAILAPSRRCPQCGGAERRDAGVLRSTRNLWLLHFGGWFIASLWGASRQKQVQCAQCETLYNADTRGTRIAGILLWIFVLLTIATVGLTIVLHRS